MATTAIAEPHTQSRSARTTVHGPLALWHLLSLDAPTVALVWTCYAAACFHIALPWTAPAALAVAVWMLYAADRLCDARHPREPLQERHRFHAQHARAFCAALAFAACTLVVLLLRLPGLLRTAWAALAVPLLCYVAAVHVFRLRVPKEAMVGVFFATATVMPCMIVAPSAPVLAGAMLFGVLCWMNCVVIARMEGVLTQTPGPVTAWCARNLRAAATGLAGIAGVTFLLAPECRGMSLAVALSVALLLVLDGATVRAMRESPPVRSARTGHTASRGYTAFVVHDVSLRALADAALLTPLLLWPLLLWSLLRHLP